MYYFSFCGGDSVDDAQVILLPELRDENLENSDAVFDRYPYTLILLISP
jgi:hypothetical protein